MKKTIMLLVNYTWKKYTIATRCRWRRAWVHP